jgi:hypothetical protein
MATALSGRPVAAAGVSSGSGVLRGTYLFDFDAGGETANQQAADVWWEQMTTTARQMVPHNGAALCAMGIVAFDPLSLSDLQNLPYSTTPIPANVSGTNLLPDGSVFAVRTKTGSFVKVQVLHYDYNLQIRWQTCTRPINFLDVKVTLGSTPTWLLTRYVAECTYNTPNGIRSCGTGTFGPEGGIVHGQISDESGAFPSSILVTVSLDFQPDTNLAAIMKKFTPPVTNTGVNFIFEPFQVLQKTDVLLDLQPAPTTRDYLLLRWRHDANGQVVASGQKYLPGDELRQQLVTQYEIVFVPDPISAEHFNIQIEGRFQGEALQLFTQTYELADKAVLIRAQKSTSTSGYMLVSV